MAKIGLEELDEGVIHINHSLAGDVLQQLMLEGG